MCVCGGLCEEKYVFEMCTCMCVCVLHSLDTVSMASSKKRFLSGSLSVCSLRPVEGERKGRRERGQGGEGRREGDNRRRM